MRIIWKYEIPIKHSIDLILPDGAEILHFGMQYSKPRLWILVNTTNEKVERHFRIIGTGHEIVDDNLHYIGTVKMKEGTRIYHLFELV